MGLIGQKVGPYEILEEIGRGGMGVVFKARHEKLGRLVALKMLAPHLAGNPKMRARFLREAKLQANLNHPNVVNIFDYLEEGENAFLVMEYVSGQTLEEMLLKKGRFSVEETLHVAKGVLEALSFMHRKGIIHRDIKPSNIMVTETGLVKVTDFGIARLAEEEAPITQVGGKIGTLFYMAPELLKEGKLSPAADIYSLGVTLFQLLSGKVPFTGKTEYEIIEAHLKKPPPDLQKLNPAVPKELATLIKQALAKRPEERFASADEFLVALKALKGEAVSHPPKKALNPPKPSLNFPYLWVIIVLAGLVLLLFFWFHFHKPKKNIIIPARVTLPSGGGGAGQPFSPSALTGELPPLFPSERPFVPKEKQKPPLFPKTTKKVERKHAVKKGAVQEKAPQRQAVQEKPSQRQEGGWVIRK